MLTNITTGTLFNNASKKFDRLPSTITKDLTGNVTGNLVGDVTGDVTGTPQLRLLILLMQ